MSIQTIEISRWLGRPVELYRFTRQHLAWLYTSTDQPVSVGGETFMPLAITRDGIRESYERQKRNLKLTLPVTAEVAANWRPFPPADTVGITVLALHRGEAETEVQWMGRVVQPRYTDTTLELTCSPGSGANRPRGLQLRFQRSCCLALYSQGVGMCNLDPADFAEPATLTSVSGNVISATEWAALPPGRLAGGFVRWEAASGLVERRSITAHVGAALHLHYGAEDLAPGLEVTAHHGCAHNYADCSAKGNGPNYGGCPNLPQKNPFSGNPIW